MNQTVPMHCDEVLSFLSDYLDHALEDAVLARFEWHLERCVSCRNYLSAYRETIAMARMASRPRAPFEDPPEVLVQAILLAQKSEGRSRQE